MTALGGPGEFVGGGDSWVGMQHPEYMEARIDWDLMRDCLGGNRVMKEKGETYLPMPSGFRLQPDGGVAYYNAYKTRAKFPPLVSPILRGMAGILFRMEPKIAVPKALNGILERATRTGDSIEILFRRIIRDLLTTGRVGLLTDMSEEHGDLPYLAFYEAERVVNWSKDRDFYVLDETKLVRNGYTWWPGRSFRVLEILEDGTYQVRVYDYTDGGEHTEYEPVKPQQRGGATVTEIPFTIMGALDTATEPGEVPLLGVGEAAIAGYRLDADYRHQLYMSGQETFVCIGVNKDDAPTALGASVILTLPEGSDAKYVGPNCIGIQAHREAMADEVEAAAIAGARMFINPKTGRSQESGDALRLRFTGETATLVSIGQSAASGLERALKHAALFVGANPDDVVVTPNLEMVDAALPPADAVNLMQLWLQGAISKQTLYENLQKGEIASQERTLDEEQALIDEEVPPASTSIAIPPKNGGTGTGSITKPPTNADLQLWKAQHATITEQRAQVDHKTNIQNSIITTKANAKAKSRAKGGR